MRLARHSALTLIILAMAVWRPTQDREVSPDRLGVNGPVPRFSLERNEIPFQCDSLEAPDCFEMFARHTGSITAITIAARTPLPDRIGPADTDRRESIACALDIVGRGDRCLLRGRR